MLAAQATTSTGSTALATAVLIGLAYLVIVRFLDLNEKEPLWATALVFGLGAVTSTYLHLVAGSRFLELELVGGVVVRELVLFATIAAGMGVLTAVGRLRGWQDVNGVMDGVVYGAATGLGFATGATFVRELVFASGAALGQGPIEQLWPVAVAGLAMGVFGGIIGAGFGAAAGRGTGTVALPLAGLVAATIAHLGHQYARVQTPASATAIKWVALVVPVLVVVGVIAFALVREQRAIADELADEAEAGVVTADELRLLQSFVARRAAYFRRLTSGDFDGWMAVRELHTRQVQLALTERRLRRAGDAERRRQIGTEVERLRASIVHLKSQNSAPATTTTATAEA